jgi:hypothetical protein
MTHGYDLLGNGPSITLTDGTTVPLRYSMRAIALLERRYGSVSGIETAIDTTGRGAAFGPVVELVGAGCLGPGGFQPLLREHQDAKGNRQVTEITYRRSTDGADLADLMHPGYLGEYVSAFRTAFGVALKALGNDDAPEETTGAAIETSPGLSSTTSPSVPSTFLPATSGT